MSEPGAKNEAGDRPAERPADRPPTRPAEPAKERRADRPEPNSRTERAKRNVEKRIPRNRWARMGLGGALVVGGVLGFLPILGFWMIPLGLFVLSYDLPPAARLRHRVERWWHDRRDAPGETGRD
jgi:hypothetical protein